MKLFMVRHGETDWNIRNLIQGSTDILLNDNGRRQSEALGEELAARRLMPVRIYTSRLRRAQQTAQILSRMTGAPCQLEEGLEEMCLGAWEGKTWRQIREEFSTEYAYWYENRRYTRTPQGESYQDLLDRLVPALLRIVRREKEDVFVVTHSACIMTLLSYLNDTPFEDMAKNYRLGNAAICELSEETLLKGCREYL